MALINEMSVEALQDWSVYYFIKDLFAPVSFMNVRDEFPSTQLIKEDLPIISIESSFLRPRKFEMGNRLYHDIRRYQIHIFAKDNSTKKEYAYAIKNAIQQKIPVKDYNAGFPPNVVATLGVLDVDDIEGNPIPVFAELVGTLYYRYRIMFTAEYSVAPSS